jgi:putative ABC transport system permease protein
MQGLLGVLPYAVSEGLIWGVMALGLYITNKILDFSDLTVDGSIVTGAAVCAVMMMQGVNPWVAMLCAMLAGGLCGLLTGSLHTVFGIPPILSGILTQLMLYSINLKIMGQSNLYLQSYLYPVIITIGDVRSEPWSVIGTLLAIVVVMIAVYYWFFGTALGCSIRSTGCNINMSRAQGINTDFTKILGLVIANAFVALAGALLAQYRGPVTLTMGQGAIVIGLAAIVIGDAIFSKIARNFAVRLLGVVVGSVIYFSVYQIIIYMGVEADLLKMLSAVVVALFLGVPHIKNKIMAKIHIRKRAKEVEENA